ncbi:hypothetical protein JOF53_004450 [Crossiella equi]|uniref:RING-type E3 ubiquitin transferase n=1 Tax=Crossiella equi TaxID=130796 RepID=A0ABS5AG65_9PSEU|nr:GIDE domain-containing protein [Crossiella equi]MBP2475578.1 hypothetical protein [Crossiella equi]
MVGLVLGVVLVLAGVGAYLYAHFLRREVHAMIATETEPVAELATYRSAAAEIGTGLRRAAEVVGQAVPGPYGPLRAEITGTECVWFRAQVRRRYRKVGRDHQGKRKETEATETVSDTTSSTVFGVQDATGVVLVQPQGARIDRPELTVERFERAEQAERGILATLLSSSREGTIGYEYTEWVLRPGAHLFVHGEVSDRTGQLAFGKPAQGPYVISTRSEEEVRATTSRYQLLAAWGGAGAALVGIVVIVLKLVL